MIEYNQLFYSIFAFMAFGQGLSSYIGFKDHDTYFKTQVFWSVSIYLFMFSCVFWAIAPVTNLFCLTLANSCLVGSMLSTLLLFRSFTQAFTKYHLSNALLVLIFYGVVFEFIRQGDYIPRFLLTSSTLTIICVLQIKELRAVIKNDKSTYLRLIYFLSMLLLFVLAFRFYQLFHAPDNFIKDLYHENNIGLYSRMVASSLFLLFFTSIGHYFYEKSWHQANQKLHLNKEQIHDLEDKAYYDNLTGLPNRLLLMDRLNQAMSGVKRRGGFFAILFIDLDGFKAINDHYGHQVGDEFLMAISQQLKTAIRETDSLARLGGDEFIILLDELNSQHYLEVTLPRILAACNAEIFLRAIAMQVSASIGIALYPNVIESLGDDAEALLVQADQAMYVAKQQGKNCFHVFDRSQDQVIITRNNSIEAIRLGIRHDEFELYYQPKVNMATAEVYGFEALIRWNKNHTELLAPSKFLFIVQNHPLGIELGYWVIKNALKQLKIWNEKGLNINLSVNVDARQLMQTNFVDILAAEISKQADFRAGSLVLEILESTAINDRVQVSKVINKCRDLGIEFALDDFGTGYSSITYLRELPIKILKIDRSFIAGIADYEHDFRLVSHIIHMAHDLGKQVIAEGIESIEQGELLISMGCELGQGYVIAEPMPVAAVEAWLKGWRSYPSWLTAQRSYKNYHLFFETMVDPVLMSKNGRYVDCNAAAIQFLGYPDKKSLLNLSPSDISPLLQPDGQRSVDKAKTNVERVLKDGFHRFEWLILRADGSEALIEVTLNNMTINDDNILHAVWRDLSLRD